MTHESADRKTVRVQLELGPQAYQRLNRLKQQTEAASYIEVIRMALIAYEGALEKPNTPD